MASDETMRRLARQGILPLSASQGIGTLMQLLRHPQGPVVTVCPMDPRRLPDTPYFIDVKVARLDEVDVCTTNAPRHFLPQWILLVCSMGPESRKRAIVDKIRSVIVEVGGTEDLEENTRWDEAGLDSLTMVQLRNALQRELGAAARLSSTALSDYPSLEVLAKHIESQIQTVALGEKDAKVQPLLLEDNTSTQGNESAWRSHEVQTSLGRCRALVPKKPRVLFLHGDYSNEAIAGSLLNTMGYGEMFDFVVPSALFEQSPASEEFEKGLGFDVLIRKGIYKRDDRVWTWGADWGHSFKMWQGEAVILSSAQRHKFLPKIADYLEVLSARFGPFDGVMGMCEGSATLQAALSLQHSRTRDIGLGSVKFFIAIAPWKTLLADQIDLEIPTLAIGGRNDIPFFLHEFEEFPNYFTGPFAQYRHDGAHNYPPVTEDLKKKLHELLETAGETAGREPNPEAGASRRTRMEIAAMGSRLVDDGSLGSGVPSLRHPEGAATFMTPTDDVENELLVCLRQGSENHPALVFVYSALGLAIGSAVVPFLEGLLCSVFALQAPEWSGSFPDSGERVEHHLRVLRGKFQRKGLHLIGYSFGAALAFQLAHGMAESGIRCTLSLIDPAPPSSPVSAFRGSRLRALGLDLYLASEGTSQDLEGISDREVSDDNSLDQKIEDLTGRDVGRAKTLRRATNLFRRLVAEASRVEIMPRTSVDTTIFVLSGGPEVFDRVYGPGYNDDGIYGWSHAFPRAKRVRMTADHARFFLAAANNRHLAAYVEFLQSQWVAGK